MDSIIFSTYVGNHNSERELECFNLVDQHLFPLPEMMFDMERLPSIPVYPHIVNFAER